MINWDLYKGSKQERSKQSFVKFCKALESEGYELVEHYKGTHTRIKVICSQNHEWSCMPSSFIQGHRCRICLGQDFETVKQNFLDKLKDEGYKLIGKYKGVDSRVDVICKSSHIWSCRPADFMRGTRCKICAGNDTKTAKQNFLDKLDYEGYKLIGEYKNVSTKIKLICHNHHEWDCRPADFMQGHRCRICLGLDSEVAKQSFLNKLEEEGYKLIGEYKGNKTKVKVLCPQNHKYDCTSNNFMSGQRCPICKCNSHGERLTKKILDEYNCKYESQKKFDGLIGLGGGLLSYDFFVDNYLLIEIQGEQHYKPIYWYGGEDRFKQQQKHDRLKREFAKENGYELLEIPYFNVRDLGKLENILREKIEDYKHTKAS